MSKKLKLIHWILGGIITIFFLYAPMLSVQYDCFFIRASSKIITSLFLIYCLFSAIYWVIKKNIKLAMHYCLIVSTYIIGSIIFILIAISIG